MKRLFDVLVVLLFVPLWVPVFGLVALAVLLALGRPVFFVQTRAGKGGCPFRLIKFRSMLAGDGPDEERLTKFGRFLRASSLDELPELWNVLRGEMSLVGPRPLPMRYLPRYTSEQNRRHSVLPGITGWAQVHGRNALDWETKFRYDVEYVDRRSFLLDVKILALTAWGLLRPSGINHPGEATMSEFQPARDLASCR